MVRPFSRTARAIFIFDLNPNDRPAIFPKQAVHLLPDFVKEASNSAKVHGIIFSCRRFLDHPIRNPSVSHLAVTPRSNPNPHIEVIPLAEFDKMTKVPLF